MNSESSVKPLEDQHQLEDLLTLYYGGAVVDLMPSTLLRPAKDLLGRPGKRIRGRLVELGYELARPLALPTPQDKMALQTLVDCIECLHAGSLAVDDVQDGSKMRRGNPTLHLKYGMPIALNTGNWLYFWPLEKIQRLELDPLKELAIYRFYHQTLVRAHMGQALDVGLSVTQFSKKEIYPICLAAMELKSGALFALALKMGATLGGASPRLIRLLDKFGHGFGIALQMFDDLGNLKGRVEPAKRWEDLMLRRPTWAWALASQNYDQPIFEQFLRAVHELPHDHHLLKWLEQNEFFQQGRQKAQQHMNTCFDELDRQLGAPHRYEEIFNKLKKLAFVVSRAYE